jgi:hypothetical protein
MKFKTILGFYLLFIGLSLFQCGTKKNEVMPETAEQAEKVISERMAEQAKNADKVMKAAVKEHLKKQTKAVRKSIKRNMKAQKRRMKLIDYRKVGS